MYKVSQTDIASIELFSGNIFSIIVSPGATVDLEAAKRFVRSMNIMLPDDHGLRAGIIDLTEISEVQPEAISYFLAGGDILGKIAAVALTSSSKAGQYIAEAIAARQHEDDFPVAFFESPIRADHWVRKQMAEAKREYPKVIDLRTGNYVVEPYDKVTGRVSASN